MDITLIYEKYRLQNFGSSLLDIFSRDAHHDDHFDGHADKDSGGSHDDEHGDVHSDNE